MAGSSFLAPKSVRPSVPSRRFTLAQANSSLPLVRRIVADIVAAHGQATRIQSELDTYATRQRALAQAELEDLMIRLEDYLDELTEIGCELKDYQMGLIDFIGRHEGRDICLCWKLGEEKIAFWHELEAGFTGRQPVSKLHED